MRQKRRQGGRQGGRREIHFSKCQYKRPPPSHSAEPGKLPCSSFPLSSWRTGGGGISSWAQASEGQRSRNPAGCCTPRGASRPRARRWRSTAAGGERDRQKLRPPSQTHPLEEDVLSQLLPKLPTKLLKTTSAGAPAPGTFIWISAARAQASVTEIISQ